MGAARAASSSATPATVPLTHAGAETSPAPTTRSGATCSGATCSDTVYTADTLNTSDTSDTSDPVDAANAWCDMT